MRRWYTVSENIVSNEELTEEVVPSAEETMPDSDFNDETETTEESQSTDTTVGNAYSENYYLLYGNKEKKYLDLDGTRRFLDILGFDGGELRQARKGKDAFQIYNGSEEDNKNHMFCSYCGLEISGVEYQRLPDGRLRCTSCSNSIVKSEIQEMCDRVKWNMESFFGAIINVPISIEVLDERKLKKKLKTPIGVIDNQSILVLGAAVNEKKGYTIYLENGAPRISLIATFAHELTHIWQYINWDNKKNFASCSQDKRLIIYEGMAKWVEIQYLYLVGETAVARREEFITRNRNDEYGIGFRMIEDKYPLTYGAIVCDNAPFTKNAYPIDDN